LRKLRKNRTEKTNRLNKQINKNKQGVLVNYFFFLII